MGYTGCIGIMEKKIETTIVYWGYSGIVYGSRGLGMQQAN